MLACHHFKAACMFLVVRNTPLSHPGTGHGIGLRAIFFGRLVDVDHDGNVQRLVIHPPAGSMILESKRPTVSGTTGTGTTLALLPPLREGRPSRSCAQGGPHLVRLEALTAGVLEVDLLLVEDGLLPEELRDDVDEPLAVEGVVEALMVVEEILQSVQQTRLIVLDRLRVVHHPFPWGLGPSLHISRPLHTEGTGSVPLAKKMENGGSSARIFPKCD